MRNASLEAKERGALVSLNAEDALRVLDSNAELLEIAEIILESVDGGGRVVTFQDFHIDMLRAAIAKATGTNI